MTVLQSNSSGLEHSEFLKVLGYKINEPRRNSSRWTFHERRVAVGIAVALEWRKKREGQIVNGTLLVTRGFVTIQGAPDLSSWVSVTGQPQESPSEPSEQTLCDLQSLMM